MTDLIAVSPPVARFVERRPRLVRFLARCPRIEALHRLHGANEDDARRAVRRMRQRVFVYCAERERTGDDPLSVATVLSRFADAALQLADAIAYRSACARYPLEPGTAPDARAIFALGKLGGEELNPSSDIDIVPVCRAGDPDAVARLSLWVRGVRAFLSDVTPDGFCLRVDLDLRPDGKTGPLIQALDPFERYYERFGRTWERIAWTRARAVVDVGGVGADALKQLRAFTCPSEGHDARVADTASIRARLFATQQGSGRDIKRAPGGIRDVEFVAQLLQVSFSARFPALRVRRIDSVLGALERAGLVAAGDAHVLNDAYLFWRRIEHALQYVTDTQTQVLPDSGEVRGRVLQFFRGAEPTLTEPDFVAQIETHAEAVRRVADAMFGEIDPLASYAALALDVRADDDARRKALAALGFARPQGNLKDLAALATNPSSPFSPEAKGTARPQEASAVLQALAQSGAPDTALSRLVDMSTRVAHSGWWRIMGSDIRAANLLARVMALSAPLSRYAYLSPSTLLRAADLRRLPRRIAREAVEPDDPGTALDDEAFCHRIRAAHRDIVLTAALCFLDDKASLWRVEHALSAFVDVTLRAALVRAEAFASSRYPYSGRSHVGVLALGSLGARSLSFFGDLDLLLVWRGDNADREWAVRVGHRLLWLLSAPLGSGLPFAVDMRLRPSGNQGPLCVRDEAWANYHRERSALWERQALLKLRGVAGDPAVIRSTLEVARAAFRRTPEHGLGMQLLDMRSRMAEERTPGAGFDLKLSVGGIADVDFAVQGHLLAEARDGAPVPRCSTMRGLTHLTRIGRIDEETSDALKRALTLMHSVRAVMQLSDGQSRCVVKTDDPRMELVARLSPRLFEGAPDGAAVATRLTQAAADVRERTHRLMVQL